MTEQRIPAWKRLGLKVKKVDHDLLAIGNHLIGTEEEVKDEVKDEAKGEVNNEHKKGLKRSHEEGETNKAKKPPKRKKLPKSERPPPPEKDQLVYLRQFVEENDRWKFSKQKQNWILRNIKDIPEEYIEYMRKYVGTMKGGSRDRLVRDMKGVVEEWNGIVKEAIRELEKGEKEEEEKEEEDERGNEGEEKEEKDKEGKKEKVGKKEATVDYNYAKRASELYSILTGEELELVEGNAEKEEEKGEAEVGEAEVGEDPEKEEVETEKADPAKEEVEADPQSTQPVQSTHPLTAEDVEVTEYLESPGSENVNQPKKTKHKHKHKHKHKRRKTED
ncbi:DEKNAAC103069 [Brettanomyces naardenensis]|uniref:DEKNAAC103069 n=1 Tax=Brettanomyces naardenensis TaxID=13370 RepID=A0A448YMG9_BRENA|nr:DEKNAAC103069 [Brettanomyces naardenensis]